jgi:hypothetical protein
MHGGWIMAMVIGAGSTTLPLWLASRWLMRSWEVLDDDQLSDKLSGPPQNSPADWLDLRGWFKRKPRQLTYRRDGRGRFRRVRR